MHIFWNKNVKITSASVRQNPRLPPAAGGSAHRPPRYYSCLLLQVFWVHFTR